MAAVLIATVGHADANAYLTVAAAALYFDTRPTSASWDDASAGARIRALIQATRQIDTLRFRGESVTDAQALKWPRVSVFNEDGYEYPTNAIPQIVQDATCEAAFQMLVAGADTLADTGLEGFKRAKVGPLEVELRARRAARLPDYVLTLLRPVLLGVGMMARLVRS